MMKHRCPATENPMVWVAACTLAARRHATADYPQPSDVDDARAALEAAAQAIADALIKAIRP